MWVIGNVTGHLRKNGKRPKHVTHEDSHLSCWEMILQLTPETKGHWSQGSLKGHASKSRCCFLSGRYQLSKETVTWTWSLAFRLLTPLSLPPWGLQWPPAVGFHLLISHRYFQKKMLETVLYRYKLNLKTFYKGPTYSHLTAKRSGEKTSFYILTTLVIQRLAAWEGFI